jgi:tetratricopeptide (TPR) repeat protein
MFIDVQDALRQIVNEEAQFRLEPSGKLLQALEHFPLAAELHFFYGSELAETGEVEQAVKSLGQALVLNPDMYIARFQLAFLHLVNGNVDAVKVLLQPLLKNDNNLVYLSFFARGCIAAAAGSIEECRQFIQQGLALNNANLALNANMKKLTELLSSDPQEELHNDNVSDGSLGSVLFDIYTQQKH